MANTKLPARLLDTSAVPALNVTGNLTVDTTTLVVDTINNRVGIGNSSPTADLSVGSTSTSSGNVHLRTTKTAFSITPSNTNAGGILFDLGWVNGGQGPMEFGINSDVKMSIDSSGNVGIGSSPAGKLHVYSGDAGAVTPSPQADDLVVEANTEVGITLMSPDDQSARIRFTSPSTESGDEGGADIFYRQNINKMSMGTVVSGGKLAFKSGAGVETMILDNGNVSIGSSGTFDGTGTRKVQIETNASSALGPELLIHNAGQGSGALAALTFGGKRSGNEGYTASIHTTNNDGLFFGTVAATDFSALPTTRMHIDADGATEIVSGTSTAPAGNTHAQLTVKTSVNANPASAVLAFHSGVGRLGVIEGQQRAGGSAGYGHISTIVNNGQSGSGAMVRAITANHTGKVGVGKGHSITPDMNLEVYAYNETSQWTSSGSYHGGTQAFGILSNSPPAPVAGDYGYYKDFWYYMSGNTSHTMVWDNADSYFNAEVMLVAACTNGGAHNNIFCRGFWSNNHTAHRFDGIEGFRTASSTSSFETTQNSAGAGGIGGLTNGDYFTFTAGAGTNASNSGKLTIVHQYPGASFYGAKIRVRVFFGQFNGHSSTS